MRVVITQGPAAPPPAPTAKPPSRWGARGLRGCCQLTTICASSPMGRRPPCDRNVSSRKGPDAARSPRTRRLAMVSGASGRQALRLDPARREVDPPHGRAGLGGSPTAHCHPSPQRIAGAPMRRALRSAGVGRPCGWRSPPVWPSSATATVDDPECTRLICSTPVRPTGWQRPLLSRAARSGPGRAAVQRNAGLARRSTATARRTAAPGEPTSQTSRHSPSSPDASNEAGRAPYVGPPVPASGLGSLSGSTLHCENVILGGNDWLGSGE